ncbi:MAG: AI-2E family transporter [Duncaniella sp.]|nr:AI-2E family transporter [Duncaniella sp.]
MSVSRPYTFDRVVRIVGGIALLAGAVWLINLLKNVLLPFCAACLIAYLLEPLVEIQQRWLRLKGRVIPIFLTLVEVACVLALMGYFFVPSVVNEIHDMGEMLKNSSGEGTSVPFVPQKVVDYVNRYINTIKINELLESGRFETIVDTGTSVITSTLNFLFHTLEWLLMFIYVIFVLIDYEHLMKGFRLLVPPKYRPIAYKVGDDIKASMNRYFRGQALIALCAAVFYCIGFSIVGIPLAIVLGILVGVLYMIPYFQYVTLIPVTLVCLIDSMGGHVGFWPQLGQCILVYVVSQCICDYVLTPKIMGKAMGLNPAIILLSLSVWGTLLGLIGMIIALPLTTLLLAYYQQYVLNRHDIPDSEKLEDRSTLHEITDK